MKAISESKDTPPGLLRRSATALVALALIGVSYAMARFPSLPPDDRAQLAKRFRFDKIPLAEIANHPPYRTVREVHPSLRRIAAWISTLGAAAAMADLDGD